MSSGPDAVRLPLSEEIRAPDPEVRWRVAAVLSDVPGGEAERLLVGLLADPDYRVREKSVAALSRRFTPSVATACAEALADDSNAGRRSAGLALLTRGGDLGLRVLVDALGHPSPDVRLAAANALPSVDGGPGVVGSLEEALRHEGDANVRAALLLALGRTGRREAIGPLLAALSEGSLWIQTHALEALGEVGDPDLLPRLLPLVDRAPLRRATLRALARLGAAAAAEPLALRAADGELDPELVAALRRSAEAAPAGTAARLLELWPAAGTVLTRILESADAGYGVRCDAAALLARLDVPGAALTIVRLGASPAEYGAIRSLWPHRFGEALHAVLQEDDPEPALALVERAKELSETAFLAPLLVHPSPGVKVAVLAALPAGLAPLEDVIDVLAEDEPETALPAALSLARVPEGTHPDRAKAQRQALLDRASGPDGAGRVAALVALGALPPGEERDEALRHALASDDPAVRRAAIQAAGLAGALREEELLARLEDPEPSVRAAVLRALARWAEAGRAVRTTWRDVLTCLADENAVAAAAGEALIALAGEERPRLAEEFLAQGDAIRHAALDEIPRTGDREAAHAVAHAVRHEDAETARAVLNALVVASEGVAERAVVEALGDPRAEVRGAAAELVSRRERPAAFDGALAEALARALAAERDPSAMVSLLAAVAVAGGESALEPLTEVLARERVSPEATTAAAALAGRFPAAAKRRWTAAPARAERRWAKALALARRGETAAGPA